MRKVTIIFTLIFIVLSVQIGLGQSLSREQQKELLINAAKLLEVNPFHKDAKDIRAWAIRYVIETDDVSVIVCGNDVMKAILDKKNKFSSELTAQYTIAMAAFKLLNPNNKNENEAQLAGVESMLRAYEQMVKEKPKNRFAGIDDLLAKRESGELKGMIEQANCGNK